MVSRYSNYTVKRIVGTVVIIALTVHLQFFVNPPLRQEKATSATIKENVHQLQQRIDTLARVAAGYATGSASLPTLQGALHRTRLAYKKVECILEFYYPQHVRAYINGPPLEHLNPFPIDQQHQEGAYYGISPEDYARSLPLDRLDTDHYRGSPELVLPEGLQVLDELIASDPAEDEKQRMMMLCEALQENYQTLVTAVDKRALFPDFEMMEAGRLELVRMVSLGITGFDTPGSLNAISEARASLAGILDVLQPLVEASDKKHRNRILTLFRNADRFLAKNDDFSSFDRLDFLTEHINPLYEALYRLQQARGIRTSVAVTGETPSWNAGSTNMFGNDFLNPYYYTLLTKEEDTEPLRELGEQLFYDPVLSQRGTMSCASCHQPELAFTDGEPQSFANAGQRVGRNAPTLINAVFSDRYFYDLRAFDLEEQAEHVVADSLEFNTSFAEVVRKLNADRHYSTAFEQVFRTGKPINRYEFSKALASYVVSLRGFNSAFDRYVQGKTNQLDTRVKRGFNLFMGKANCGTCHFAPTFSGLVPPLFDENESEVLGVLEGPEGGHVDADPGRFANGLSTDQERIYHRSFKTTTVRNIALTAPYFHNGGYPTLSDVVEFYDQGGAAGRGLTYEVPQQTLPPDALRLSGEEKEDIIAFMQSLTNH